MTTASHIVGRRRRIGPIRPDGILIGEDWALLNGRTDGGGGPRSRLGFIASGRSPLARKIIIFNLLALVLMIGGISLLNPLQSTLTAEREAGLLGQAELIAGFLAAGSKAHAPEQRLTTLLAGISPDSDIEIFLFDQNGKILLHHHAEAAEQPARTLGATILGDFLDAVWQGSSRIFRVENKPSPPDAANLAGAAYERASLGKPAMLSRQDEAGRTGLAVALPLQGGGENAILSLVSFPRDVDILVREKQEKILQVFVVAMLVSVVLSLIVASTISSPLADLAAAAEGRGNDRNGRKAVDRVRIPDLAARPDEIGRLSMAMRGMVSALYDRIDANEQFAADVAHEVKNPLASLRSAVGSLRLIRKQKQRDRLLDVIEHDVRRLDRLVSDISNASRLDSELVREEEEEFDLVPMLVNLAQYLGDQARKQDIEFLSDLPDQIITIRGLEGRLAQVFVNLITNAISFCHGGGAVRLWARCHKNRVLVVVEDTGPGIPEESLGKIFRRFYSDRPSHSFGNNSGLGLSISKQIVEAHGGVIWAENIRPADAGPETPSQGARFVVGLPL